MKAVIVTSPQNGLAVHIEVSSATVFSVYDDTTADDNTILATAKYLAEKLDENIITLYRKEI